MASIEERPKQQIKNVIPNATNEQITSEIAVESKAETISSKPLVATVVSTEISTKNKNVKVGVVEKKNKKYHTVIKSEATKSNQKINTKNKNNNNNNSFFEINESFKSVSKNKKANNVVRTNKMEFIPDELVVYVASFLDKDSQFSLRRAAQRYRRIIDINDNKTAFFKSIDKNVFLSELLNANNNELITSCPALKSFISLNSLSPEFVQSIQSHFNSLTQKYHVTTNGININSLERQLLHFYRTLMDKEGKMDVNKLYKAIESLRHFLYESKQLQYKIVFHVESSNNLQSAIEHWQTNNNNNNNDVCFDVSPHETFFYPIENIGFPSLRPTTIISISVIPSFNFSNNLDYNNKTDYHREYNIFSTNNFGSKMKQSHIGSNSYLVDPDCRILTWQIGAPNEPGKYIINEDRHLGIDIALTGDTKCQLKGYLENLKNKICYERNSISNSLKT